MTDTCPCVDHVVELGVILRCILPVGHDGDHWASDIEPDTSGRNEP